MDRMSRWLLWSQFDVSRFTFYENVHKNYFTFSFSMSLTFDLLASNLLSRLLVSKVTSLWNLKFLRLSDFQQIVDNHRRTDRQTNRRRDARFMRTPREGHVISVHNSKLFIGVHCRPTSHILTIHKHTMSRPAASWHQQSNLRDDRYEYDTNRLLAIDNPAYSSLSDIAHSYLADDYHYCRHDILGLGICGFSPSSGDLFDRVE